MKSTSRTLLASIVLGGLPMSLTAGDAAPWSLHKNPIPPRLQWEANGGYCGEVSLISAGLYYGQYLSQYEARRCAIGDTPQNEGELLIGDNASHAAAQMHLASIAWNSAPKNRPERFLAWVKRQVLRGRPVAMAVYNNESILYSNRNPLAGDAQYDHIVPVTAIRSQHPLSDSRYFTSDRITFSDNGLFGGPGTHPYFFTYSFSRFPGTRIQANAPGGPLYTLPAYGHNYAIAITGVMDRDGDTLPVRVETNKNYEWPEMHPNATQRPDPMHLTLTITVSGLQPGVAYKLYRYDQLSSVPDSTFNAHAAAASQSWNILLPAGTTYVLKQSILSDDVAVYRAVRADAP